MARTSPKASPKRRLTRLDREEARDAAGSFNLGPLTRGAAVVVGVLAVALGLAIVVPNGPRLGGPLQPDQAPSLVTVRKTGGEVVTIPVPVPWNADTRSAVLERLTPVGVEGVELVKASVVPQGNDQLEPIRGLPPVTLEVVPVHGFTVTPGVSALEGFQMAVSLHGAGSVSGFVLTYRIDDVVTSAFIPAGAMLCEDRCTGKADVIERQRALNAELASFIDAPER